MSDTVKYALIAAAVLYVIRARQTEKAAQDVSGAGDFERPQWGSNWISNQWAMIQQGTLASTGQIKPGGYL